MALVLATATISLPFSRKKRRLPPLWVWVWGAGGVAMRTQIEMKKNGGWRKESATTNNRWHGKTEREKQREFDRIRRTKMGDAADDAALMGQDVTNRSHGSQVAGVASTNRQTKNNSIAFWLGIR